MQILVTGAAGFIGAKTAEELLDAGYEIVGVDNINDYYDVRLKYWRLEQLKKTKNFKFYHTDIEDLPALEKIFSEHKFDAIINLAARAGVGYSMVNPHIYLTTNAHGALNLLEMCRKYGVRKFILASTSSVYSGQPMPFKETLPANTPISPYAAAKRSAEMFGYTYHSLFGIDVTVLRYFTVFGPAGRPDMSYFRFIKWIDEGIPIKLYGDGSQSRDFTFIDDIAAGTIAALKPLGYEIINLGGGQNPYTVNFMIEILENFIGKKAVIDYLPFQKTDMKDTWADISKAEELLGWKPKTNFPDGLKHTVEWYMRNKSFLKGIQV